ncbi:MAG TPA: hypothetical protein DDW55_14685 [Gammaproteobacteria bacterium]|nr:hypothetical protein [Gammaproteobacteria bacterium]
MKQAFFFGAVLLNLGVIVAAALVIVQQTRQPVEVPQVIAVPAVAPEAVIVSGKITGQILVVESASHARVSELHADVGQLVEKGSVLLMLDDPELTDRVHTARERKLTLSGSLDGADELLKTLREEVPQQIWTAEQKAVDARAEVVARQEKYDQVSRIAWRLEKKARDNLAASQVAEPAKLRAIIEKNAEVETLAAQLKSARYRNSLLEAQALLAQAENDLALAEASSQKIEALAANVRVQHMQAQQAASVLEEQEAQLAVLSIQSPETGTIMSVDVSKGQIVEQGSHLLTLSLADILYFEAELSADEVRSLEPGMDAELRVDRLPDKRFKARVVEMSRRAEPAGGDQSDAQVRVNIVRLQILDNSEGLLKPGMAAHTILQPPKNLPIPNAAGAHAGEAE